MAVIYLHSGEECLVDDGDFVFLSQFKWSASRSATNYAQTNVRRPHGGWRTARMHRLLLGEPPSAIDHINRNGLDNRRCNLRLATASQNAANVAPRSKSGYKGVRLSPKSGWIAEAHANRKTVYLGIYATPEEAALAYDRWAIERHGEFAWLNFPERVAA